MKYLNIAKLREKNNKETKHLEFLMEMSERGDKLAESQIPDQMAIIRVLNILESCFEEK